MSQEDVLVQSPAAGAVPEVAAPAAPTAPVPENAPVAGAAPQSSPPTISGMDGISLLAIYHFVLAGLFLLGTVGVAIPAGITAIIGIVDDPGVLVATFILAIIAIVLMFFTAFFLAVGYGLWKRRQWARIASMVIAVLSLFGMPIGTVIGGFTIWYLIKPEVVEQFEG